jgi:hypothetical protein
MGNWWDRQTEIDVVAVGQEVLLLGECKWAARPLGTNILNDPQRKAQAVTRRGKWRRVHHALFSRSGFTPTLTTRSKNEGVLLLDLKILAHSSKMERLYMYITMPYTFYTLYTVSEVEWICEHTQIQNGHTQT